MGLGPGEPLSAQACKVRIGPYLKPPSIGNPTVVLYNSKWTATPETALLDTSNMEGMGFEDQVGGLRKLDVHIEGWWDAGANPYDTPLNLFDGSYVSFALYTNDIGSPAWIGQGIVKGVPMTADVKDLIKYTLDLKAKGVFAIPTGNAV
jgi:hypothetical protein